jgi:hypothetical protein
MVNLSFLNVPVQMSRVVDLKFSNLENELAKSTRTNNIQLNGYFPIQSLKSIDTFKSSIPIAYFSNQS